MAAYANTGQFDLARKRAEQRANAEQQGQDDALKRRFAAQGSLNSGAFIKQQAIQADAASKRKADVMEGIDVAEAGEAQRQREVMEGRQFQTSERLGSQSFANQQRLGSQDFANQQRLGSQEFSRGERLGSQDFSAGQADIQRRFQTSERIGSQDFSRGEREASQAWQGGENALSRALQQQQIDNQASQWKQQFDAEYSNEIDPATGQPMGLKRQQMKAQVDEWARRYQLDKDAQDFNTYLAVMEYNADVFTPDIHTGGSFNLGGKSTSWQTY